MAGTTRGARRVIRKAFVMQVSPSKHDEYQRRHDDLWPDLRRELDRAGVVTYSIFLHPGTSQLFAYVEFTDQAQWNAVAGTDACQRWWGHMGDIMPSNEDGSPTSENLREVFHMAGPSARA